MSQNFLGPGPQQSEFNALQASSSAQQDGLAIVSNGNTHAAIASGQFVYVRNHSSLAEGLYKATAAIATNGTLSTSNLTADASGGMNALKADIDTLNSNLETKDISSLLSVNVAIGTLVSKNAFRTGNVIEIVLVCNPVADEQVGMQCVRGTLGGIPLPRSAGSKVVGYSTYGNRFYATSIAANGSFESLVVIGTSVATDETRIRVTYIV